METRGLLFIPDISGFTRFVNESDIDHSRLIIQELLEILISANNLGLQVSEIEGDAILFYKYGAAPDIEMIYRQVEKMFCEFHKTIVSYDRRRYCQCAACNSTIYLTLKVITHYGEFTGYNVQQFHKLIGKDIIVAHQLLKNDIPQHEYWLVTNSLLQSSAPAGMAEWMQWSSSTKQTENGEVPFHFTQLSELRNHITPDIVPLLNLSDKKKSISLTKEYATNLVNLFHATGDFNFRNKWQEGVKKIEEIGHLLPRVGMRCKTIMDNGELFIYSSSYSYQDNKIEFSETDETRNRVTYYTLEKLNDQNTRLTIDYYISKNYASSALFELFQRNKMQSGLKRSLDKLEELSKTIHFPG
jgi:hypothetical protein